MVECIHKLDLRYINVKHSQAVLFKDKVSSIWALVISNEES